MGMSVDIETNQLVKTLGRACVSHLTHTVHTNQTDRQEYEHTHTYTTHRRAPYSVLGEQLGPPLHSSSCC